MQLPQEGHMSDPVPIFNRSATGDNDQMIGTMQHAVSISSLLFSAAAIPFIAIVLAVLLREREYSRSAFFTIYKVGLAYDLTALVTLLIFRVIPSFGMLEKLLTATTVPARVSAQYRATQLTIYFACFTRLGQAFTNLFISLNRSSAILLPLVHKRIWSSRRLLNLCFLVQLLSTALISWRASSFGVHFLRYPQGQLIAASNPSPELYKFWRAIIVPLATLLIFLAFVYILILCKYRNRTMATIGSMNNRRSSSTERKQVHALFLIALSIVVMETINSVFFFHTFVYKINYQRDYRIFLIVVLVLSDCYYSLPSILICVFCASVQRDMRRFVRCERVS